MNAFDKNLANIIKSLKSNYGQDFFKSLTLQLHELIHADYTFIAKLDVKRHVSQTISLVVDGVVVDNFEYDLAGTPCADVSGDTVCIYPKNICSLYPSDQLLIDMGVEGYIGTPLHDSSGAVFGLVVALYKLPISDTDYVVNLFQLFAGRISAELEREDKEQQLLELNKNLEQKVEQRTHELSRAINKLIEQEKMASIGNLVAGVAHEINTPLGVAVLCSSNIKETISKLDNKIKDSALTKNDLENSVEHIKSAEDSLAYNLQRAATLVDNFKEMAVGVNTDELMTIDVNKQLSKLLGSLQPMLKKKRVTVDFPMSSNSLSFETYPSNLSQVITNLVSNCFTHAFELDDECKDRKILLSTELRDNCLFLTISDNGKGMDFETQQQIFEPFYTTKRGQGGTGLGLSIVKNIVNLNLNGKLEVKSAPGKGTTFQLELRALS